MIVVLITADDRLQFDPVADVRLVCGQIFFTHRIAHADLLTDAFGVLLGLAVLHSVRSGQLGHTAGSTDIR